MADLDFNKNDDKMRLLISQMKRKHAQVALGGGKKKIEKQHVKGKLTARERIDYLKDTDANFLEIGAFVGDGMYAEYGGCPSGGVVAGMTYIKEVQCLVVANDATVKAGAWFPITGKKNLSVCKKLPWRTDYRSSTLVDSAGVLSYQCKMRYSQTRSTLAECSEIMLVMSSMGIITNIRNHGRLCRGRSLPSYHE